VASTRLLNSHLRKFRLELLKEKSKLINWKPDEHFLLSLLFIKFRKKGFFFSSLHGYVANVYHEQIGALRYKSYRGITRKALAVWITTAFEMAFVINQFGTSIYKDGQQMGVLLHDGNLVSSDGKHLLLRIDYSNQIEYSVYQNDNIIAGLPEKLDKKAIRNKAIYYYEKVDPPTIDLLNAICFLNALKINIEELGNKES
jgi:hypothetical protein